MLEYLQYCPDSVVYQAIAKNVAPILTVPDFFHSLTLLTVTAGRALHLFGGSSVKKEVSTDAPTVIGIRCAEGFA